MLSEARPARKADYREPEGKSILLRPIIYLKNIDTSSFYSIYCQIRHHMLQLLCDRRSTLCCGTVVSESTILRGGEYYAGQE